MEPVYLVQRGGLGIVVWECDPKTLKRIRLLDPRELVGKELKKLLVSEPGTEEDVPTTTPT
jgi:hypothetical protein